MEENWNTRAIKANEIVNYKIKDIVSKCCGATVSIGGIGDFNDKDEVSTMYYVCSRCKHPCDSDN